ncbi:MAG TPA: general secretion pathway protein GspB [Steroidobacteraceae bacterium]|nr:general secretion pathway protein GspB [Steroidobacteraceae bacterium]
MSFILDALKKSEAERQRQSGPTLLELRITQPPRRYPAWAIWVGALLALNVAVLLYTLLLRRPVTPEPALATVAPSVAPAPAAVTARTTAPSVAGAAAAPGAPGSTLTPSPSVANPGTAAPAAASPNVTAVAPLAPAQLGAGSAAAPAAASTNPADDEPAVPASAVNSASVNYSTLPSLSSLGGGLPTLQLNLLDYSPLAAERFALINMHRVREGDVLPEGPRVLAITREGVALDYRGQDFMLRSSGSGSSP